MPDRKPKRRKPAAGHAITKKRVAAAEAEAPRAFELPDAGQTAPEELEPWGMDRLTMRQRLFVKYYVGEAHGNATQAARMAGYSDSNDRVLRVNACKVLHSPYIQRAIARAFADRFGSPEDVRAGVAEIASSSAADFLSPGPDGKLGFDLERMAEAAALGTIKGIDIEVIEAGGSVKTIKRKLRMYDRLRALELLARMNGQLVDRATVDVAGAVAHTHTVGVTDEVRKILGDRDTLELANSLARRLALNAGGPGESAN